MTDNRRQIKCLTDQTAASIRGSQVIGSVSRAIEELVHNSVEGCAKSCVVSVGKSEIIVSDDGMGIDPEAMRMFIGTEYCSNDSHDRVVAKKGEALRSIASLCVEMKIETACCSKNADNRKRKLGTKEVPKSGSNGYIIRSEKVFKDGVVVSFNQSSGGNAISSVIIPTLSDAYKEKAGTTITIRGLFHRHAVRRKHSNLAGEEKESSSAELAQIRACLRLLALSYPNVAFELRNGSTGKVDCSYKSPEWAHKFTGPSTSSLPTVTATSPSLIMESRALTLRLCEVYPNDFIEENSIELAFEENKETSNSKKDSSRTNFRVFGALCISDDSDEDTVRNRELEIVSINGRLATHSDKLADIILSQVRLCRGNKPNYSVCFFIHISSRSGELVVKDSIATISIPQVDRLAKFLKRMVGKAIMDSEQTMVYDVRNADSQSSTCMQNSSWNIGEKRIVKGQYIMSSTFKTTSVATKGSGKNQRTRQPKPPSSPFSSAFFDTDEPKKSTETEMKSKIKPDEDLSMLSFEDAFLGDTRKSETSNPTNNDSSYDFDDDVQDTTVASSLWTKQRVKGLERKIANIGACEEKISLTKEMLAKAEVIAQVEEKFIIIKACGVLCAVDQHAADERIALEKLESALFNPEMHDGMMIHMTNKSIMVSDILKRSKLIPPKRISLTQKDMSTVKHHWSLLQKWKFTFEESDDKSLLLTGLAKVCDRVASVNNFLEFVKELGHITGGEIKPAFVKNVLASNACRYAIMFGDYLTHEKCVELIASLSRLVG